jgi:diaminohydroxyphosphoribosylaminopyrimidine deaminase / 5-amino-6-(5-phosphoribosylamino)uracil reductase
MAANADEFDRAMMRRAMRLAMNGRGRAEPNPMVGCVITRDHRILGEGYHTHFGGPHAEPAAMADCTESPAGATAYVTLEPCCHTNKKTPPCVPALIAARVARVVVGCLDPSPEVDGKGLAALRDAGVRVDGPLLENEAKQLLAPFIARTHHRRPYVTLKWAQSFNGYVAARMGKPVRITNTTSDRVVQELRGRCDAIAVGTNTVLNDDPLLTVRGVEAHRPLLRVVLSNSLKIHPGSRLVKTAREHPLLVYCSTSSATAQVEVAEMLRRAGAEVVALPDHEGHFSFPDVMGDLHRRQVTHLLVEPGPTLARAMIARGQADRIWIFRSPTPIDGHQALAAPMVAYPPTGDLDLSGDRLTEYLNPTPSICYALEPSADFVLTRDRAGFS